MRSFASGILGAAICLSASAFTAAPANAWESRDGYSRPSYRSNCCYRRVVRQVVTYRRVRQHYRYDGGYRRSGYRYQPYYPRSYRSTGYGDGYDTRSHRSTGYPIYRQPYRYSSRSYYAQPYSYSRSRSHYARPYGHSRSYNARPYAHSGYDRSYYERPRYYEPYRYRNAGYRYNDEPRYRYSDW